MTTQQIHLDDLLLAAAQRLRGIRLDGDVARAKVQLAPNVLVTVDVSKRTLEQAISEANEAVRAKSAIQALQAKAAAAPTTTRLQPKPRTVKEMALATLSTPNFVQSNADWLTNFKVDLVGARHYAPRSLQVLETKRTGMKTLLVAEPDNPVDSNAVMVLAWCTGKNEWVHVGYVPAATAKTLRSNWPGDDRQVVLAEFADNAGMDFSVKGATTQLRITGHVRRYSEFARAR